MRGSHGVCDCDILRRANVKADLYLLRGGGFVRTLRTPPGYGHGCILVANAKLYLTANRACCDLQLMRTFRHKPLPKTDTLLTIQLQTSYYEVAIVLVNISMFGNHNNHG